METYLFELAGADPARVFSPYCWRTSLAMAHKDLTWLGVPWRFSDQARIAPYGSKTVPVLLDGDRVVVDSWVIADYLERTYADAPSIFGGAAAQAVTKFVKLWTERTLHPLITRMIILDILDVLHEDDRAYFRASREKRLGAPLEAVVADREQTRVVFRQALDPLRALLADQPFIGGAAPLYADYIVFGAFMWARGVSPFPLLAEDDPVHAWRARLLDRFDGLAARAPGFPV